MEDFIHNGPLTEIARDINRLKKQMREQALMPLFTPLVPSGDTTGAKDTYNIKAAIDNAITFSATTVVLGSGLFYISSTLYISESNVKLVGQGEGFDSTHYATCIKWVGSAGGTMLEIAPISPYGHHLQHNGVNGIFWNGNNSAAIGINLLSTNYGYYNIVGEEFTTSLVNMSQVQYALTPWRNCQFNTISIIGTCYASNGSILKLGGTSVPDISNTSHNMFPRIDAFYGYGGTGGAAVDIGAADNNFFGLLRLWKAAGTNHTAVGLLLRASSVQYLDNYYNRFEYVQACSDSNGFGGGVWAQGTETETWPSYGNGIRHLDQANCGSAYPPVTIGTGASLAYEGDAFHV